MERLAVHAARPDGHAPHAVRLQPAPRRLAGRQGHGRSVVEPAEVAEQDRAEDAQAVMSEVMVVIGVEAAGDGHAHAAGRDEGGPAERAFRGDVNHVGREPLQQELEQVRAGQAEPELRVERQRQAEDPFRCPPFRRLARPDHLHHVAARPERVDPAAERPGHAVDLRRKRFRHQGQAERTRRRKTHAPSRMDGVRATPAIQ